MLDRQDTQPHLSLTESVHDRHGYSGIAHNKMLAKICSGLNKPNQQVCAHPHHLLGTSSRCSQMVSW